jgi:hypothetical protein
VCASCKEITAGGQSGGPLNAVEAARQNARDGGFARAAGSAKEIGMGDAILLDGVAQRLGDVFLPDHIAEPLRPVFSSYDLIRHASLIHLVGQTARWIPTVAPSTTWLTARTSPNARYNLKVDTNGDARPDVTYRFQFKTKTGPYFLGDTAQPFTVARVAGGKAKVVAHGTTPPNNIGPRSTPNYRSLAEKGVISLGGGGKVFAGQRDDPFFGDIGAIFDLVAIRKGTGNMGGGKDFFAGYGVHTFGVQVPIAGLHAKNSTIGVWSSVDRRTVTRRGTATRNSGAWVQVDRLANPLVNEVVIPTGLKDQWNALQPSQEGRFEKYYTSPILAAVINKLYKLGAPETGRDDLVAVLLTGVPKLNYTGPKLADLLRVNLSIPVTKDPSRLGVLAGDNQGWPNGRRLNDDVIDIELGITTNGAVTSDGVGPHGDYLATFPYLGVPH